ncbi:MAG: methyltransferase domain-containing protein [Nanoarchaeota archaeon]|nr:methyltransferase domain-containing protein [Nanoarchaeota archaeon]
MIKTNEFIESYSKILESKSIKTVLDLGCGKGRISLRFARKGIKVDGVDIKDNNISTENFTFIQKDFEDFEIAKKYDLIIASFILHFMKKEMAVELISKMKENTQNKGFNFLICMTNLDNSFKRNPENFYPDIDLLKKLYSDWKLIKYNQDFTELEEHDNLKSHNHNVIFFLAEKR